MKPPRKSAVTLADGTMVFDLPDPGPPALIKAGMAQKAVKEAAAKRPKLDVAASPMASVYKPATNNGQKPWKKVPLVSPDSIFDQLSTYSTGCGLTSKKTVQTYINNLTTARKMCGGQTVEGMLKDAQGTVDTIAAKVQRHGLSLWSHAAYLNSMLACIRHVLTCPQRAQPEVKRTVDIIQRAHKQVHLQASQPMIQNCATPRQQAGYLSYSELCKVRDSLKNGSREQLLVSFLTVIPCPRADLGSCRVYTKQPTPQELDSFKGQYMVLEGQPHICYRMYKTRRSLGIVKVALPPAVVQQTKLCLSKTGLKGPWQWLFPHARDVRHAYTNSSFSRWACLTLQRVCTNKYITLQLARHAYSSHAQAIYDVRKCKTEANRALCRQKLLQVARAMLHSPAQMLRYRFNTLGTGGPAPVDIDKMQQRPEGVANTPRWPSTCCPKRVESSRTNCLHSIKQP